MGVTGIEILLVLGGGCASCVGGILLWMFTVERKKAALLDAISRDFRVLAERAGNIDKPVGLTLQGRGSVVDVDAVVRGDHPLWHVRSTDASCTEDRRTEDRRTEDRRGDGVFVVVDVDWVDAVREARGLVLVEQLTPRLMVLSDDVDAARLRLERRGAREDLCSVLLSPTPAKCLVAAGGSVFLELPREGLRPIDVHDALLRLDDAVAVVAGRPVDRSRGVAADVGAHAPSGGPIAVATHRLA